MTRQERRWCLAYAALLAGLTSLPYLLGFAFQGEDWRFTGFVFGVEDGNSYIAKMLRGAQGDWLFRTPYTSSPQRGAFAYLPLLLLGKLAAEPAIHEQLIALFHLFRILAIPLAVLATYCFAAVFLPEQRWRRWVTVLATLGGGLGWVLTILGLSGWMGSLPLDFYSPETFGFLSLYGLPHLVLARALLFFGIVNYLRATETPRNGWLAGACFLGLTLVQPLAVLSAYLVLAVHQVFIAVSGFMRKDWRHWLPWIKAALQVGVISLPLMAYLAITFNRDPFLRAWTAQNLILSPHPAHYVIAYGLILLPAVAGGRWLFERRDEIAFLLIGWMVALPVLAYAPFNLQRRLPEGAWVALATLAAVGLAKWNGSRARWRRWVERVVLVLSLPSSLLLLAGGIGVALHPGEPAFQPAEEIVGFRELSAKAEPGSVVLTSYETGNALPAWAPVQVVIGHGPESVNLADLRTQVAAFYGGEMTDDERSAFFTTMGIRYVWRGPHERALGAWDPQLDDRISLLFRRGGYEIYAVAPYQE